MSLLIALALLSSAAHAQPLLAKPGDCGWIHGRYRMSNGSGIHRIWIIGTNHVVNLDVADSATPSPLKELFDRKSYKPWRDEVFADFYVCAIAPRIQGHMQRVHLEKLKNSRVVTYPGS